MSRSNSPSGIGKPAAELPMIKPLAFHNGVTTLMACQSPVLGSWKRISSGKREGGATQSSRASSSGIATGQMRRQLAKCFRLEGS